MVQRANFDIGCCPTCGKKSYTTKARAKKMIKIRYRSDKELHPYKCGQYWHIGHMPRHVQRGIAPRGQFWTREDAS